MPTSTPYPPIRPTVTHRRPPVCAAEPTTTYRTTPAVDDTAAIREELTDQYPVLDELPELTGLLTDLKIADVAMRRAVVAMGRLDADLTVEQVTGVGLEHWLALAARHTRLDRRTLLRTARWTVRLPSFADGLTSGRLSWPQARTLTLVLRDLPAGHDDQADELLGSLLAGLPDDADPDAIIDQFRRAIFVWRDATTPEQDPISGNRLAIQPRLDGTGGSFHGEADAVALAILDDATAPRRDQLDHVGGVAGARADNLLSRLTHTCDHDTPSDAEGHDGTADGAVAEGAHADAPGTGGTALPPLTLLARLELDTALDTGRLPVEVLTRLLGGRLQVTTDAARRLLDSHGTRLRTVLVDNGHIVGVGRATRVPPGWLTDAVLAVHDTCTGPTCDRPALGADLDHAAPWWPTDHRPGGATDIDELGPLCATTNRAKETVGWRAHQQGDGLRRWTHPRSGLTTTSIPGTWRPPPTHPPRPPARTRPPHGHDPPS